MSEVLPFRAVREVPDPLSLYFRLGQHGGSAISTLLASGVRAFTGVVVEAPKSSKNARQKELMATLQSHRLDIVLDTQAIRLATPGGYSESLSKLPWGGGRMHMQRSFDCANTAATIAEYVMECGFTEVMSPTHLIESATDPWFATDMQTTILLRRELDARQARNTPILYPLAIPMAVLKDRHASLALVNALRHVPIDMLILRVVNFGKNSVPSAVRAYLDAVPVFHALGVPVIADNAGGVVGRAAAAFGAVGGLAHGITIGEHFDPSAWKRAPKEGGGFAQQPRVYVADLDMTFSKSGAEQLFETAKGKAHFACNDPQCCPRGVRDMITSPAQHFLYQRVNEIARLSAVPTHLRAGQFVDEVRNLSDRAVVSTNMDVDDDKLAERLKKKRLHLDSLRRAFTEQAKVRPPVSYSKIAPTRAAREARAAV
jgi:hypothetical protein